jgi:hypothetical protein
LFPSTPWSSEWSFPFKISSFPLKILYAFLIYPMHNTYPSHFIVLNLIIPKCLMQCRNSFHYIYIIFLKKNIYSSYICILKENLIIIILEQFVTERRGRVVNTPLSYSGGPRLKSWPGDGLS